MIGLLYAALSLLGGWFGGFFGAYFSKKGENLATKEDIAQITRVTKDIEAKISNDVWTRQRNWDMRREAAFGLVKELGSFSFACEQELEQAENYGHQNEPQVLHSSPLPPWRPTFQPNYALPGFESYVNTVIASDTRAGLEAPASFHDLDPLHAGIARYFGGKVLRMTLVIYLCGVFINNR